MKRKKSIENNLYACSRFQYFVSFVRLFFMGLSFKFFYQTSQFRNENISTIQTEKNKGKLYI